MRTKITLVGNYRKGTCKKIADVNYDVALLTRSQYNDAEKKCCFDGSDYMLGILPDNRVVSVELV